MNAENKLREAERQEEKRSGRNALSTSTAASASTTTTVTTTETGPLRKSSLKKGGRLVEKVGLESYGPPLCPARKALVFVQGAFLSISSWLSLGQKCGGRTIGL